MQLSQAREERVSREEDRDKLKLSKLTESEDIEAFLTTFERMMRGYISRTLVVSPVFMILHRRMESDNPVSVTGQEF